MEPLNKGHLQDQLFVLCNLSSYKGDFLSSVYTIVLLACPLLGGLSSFEVEGPGFEFKSRSQSTCERDLNSELSLAIQMCICVNHVFSCVDHLPVFIALVTLYLFTSSFFFFFFLPM